LGLWETQHNWFSSANWNDKLMGIISRKIGKWLHSKMLRHPYYSEIYDAHWKNTNGWESWAANDVDYWWEKPETERLIAVVSLWDRNPVAAFETYQELADEGSVHAMIWLGHCYDRGHGTEASFNKAYESYDRAMDTGSWIAALAMADLLFKHERFEECEAQLQEGVDHDFIPAFYWLAWYSMKRPNAPANYKDVEPLLKRAAEEGHPQARSYYADAMAFGQFGWRHIPKGLKLMREDIREARQWREQNYESNSVTTQDCLE
jgi:TPR repeat protein